MGAGRLKLAVDSTRERNYINQQIADANDAISEYQSDYDQFRANVSLVTDLLPLPPEIEAGGVAIANYAYYEGTQDDRDAIGDFGTNITGTAHGDADNPYTNVHTGETSTKPRFFKTSRADASADIDRALDTLDSSHLPNAMIDTASAYKAAGGSMPGSEISEAELKLAGVDPDDFDKFGTGKGEYQYLGSSGKTYTNWLGYFTGEVGSFFGQDWGGTDLEDI